MLQKIIFLIEPFRMNCEKEKLSFLEGFDMYFSLLVAKFRVHAY